MAKSLHDLALDAEHSLEQLATGLGQAGAPDQAVKTVTQTAALIRDLARQLGKGQEQTGDNQPPAPEAPPSNIHEVAQATQQDVQAAAQRRNQTGA